MAVPSSVYTSKDGSAFVQFSPGTEVYPIGSCWEAGDIPNPQPDSEPIQCFDEFRSYQTVGEKISPPGKITTTLTGLVESAVSWMETVKEAACPFSLFLTQSNCGRKNVFTNRERSYVLRGVRVTDDPVSNVMMRDSDEESTHAFNVTAWPGRVDHRELTASSLDIGAETAALLDITSCADRCAGECGPRIPLCENLITGYQTIAAAAPDILLSRDRGATFTSPITGFPVSTSVVSNACIQVDKDTTRIVAVRDTDPAAAVGEVQYSDDWGATWTSVAMGATASEGATGGASMFFLDAEHGWICTDDGRVYFSSTGGTSWTEQTTAITASGAAVMNAIHFADANIGVCVGAGNVLIETVDGGTNWSTGVGPLAGDSLDAVHVFDSQRVIVGTDGAGAANGPLWMSYDGCATWTEITEGLDPLVTDEIGDVTFLPDGMTGFLVRNLTGATMGTVFKSIDGGWSWKSITTPTNIGLFSIHACNANLAFAAGHAAGPVSFVAQISG